MSVKQINKAVLMMAAFSFFASSAHAQERHISPSAVEILSSLAANATYIKDAFADLRGGNPNPMIGSGVTMADVQNGNIKIHVTPDVSAIPRKLKVVINSAGAADGDMLLTAAPGGITSPFYNFVDVSKAVTALVYPASVTDMTVDAYRGAVGLAAVISQIDDRNGAPSSSILNKCAQKVLSTTRNYWFEVIPVNLECHAISPVNVHSAIDLLWMPQFDATSATTLAAQTESVFETAKKNLAIELITAAIIQHIQVKIQSENGSSAASRVWARNKARCFPAKGFAVRSVISALNVPFKEESTNSFVYDDLGLPAHPEPLYALADAVKYYGKNTFAEAGNPTLGNMYTLFNNFVNGSSVTKTPSLTLRALPVASAGATTPTRFSPKGVMNFQFNIRDLLSTCPGGTGDMWMCPPGVVCYCKNPDRKPTQKSSTQLYTPWVAQPHDS